MDPILRTNLLSLSNHNDEKEAGVKEGEVLVIDEEAPAAEPIPVGSTHRTPSSSKYEPIPVGSTHQTPSSSKYEPIEKEDYQDEISL